MQFEGTLTVSGDGRFKFDGMMSFTDKENFDPLSAGSEESRGGKSSYLTLALSKSQIGQEYDISTEPVHVTFQNEAEALTYLTFTPPP
jgi:hypothetical protein